MIFLYLRKRYLDYNYINNMYCIFIFNVYIVFLNELGYL